MGRRNRWLSGFALVCFALTVAASLGATGKAGRAAPAEVAVTTSTPAPQATALPLLLAGKDCSAMQSCYDRCQCQYDNCVAACGDGDASCVNSCIANWNGCREYC